MRSGYKITLGVLTIMILVTITIGTSYSYYSISSEQQDPNEVATTCFNVSYTEGTSSINLPATYPMGEANANNLSPYTFTITNTCDTGSAINYVVTLNTLTDSMTTLPLNLLRYRLDQTAPSTVNGTSDVLSNASTYDLGSALNDPSAQGVNATYNLATGSLAPGESATYNLRLWIDESATTDVIGQTFTGRVLVYSYI